MSLDVPHPKSFTELKEFIRSVIETNTNRNPNISNRWFSTKLDWPVSLISEYLSGKRKLSLNRVLEFTKFIGVDTVDTEYIILLHLKEDKNEVIQKHFNDLAKSKQHPDDQKEQLESNKFMATSFDASIVYLLLSFIDQKPGPEELEKLLYTMPHLTAEKINDLIELLIEKEIVEYDSENKRVGELKPFASFIDRNDQIAATNAVIPCLENSIRFVESEYDNDNFHFIQALKRLPTHRIDDVKRKCRELYGFIHNLSEEATEDDLMTPYQFCAHFFPIVDEDDKTWQKLIG